MNKSSYFIENKARFGSYPAQESVKELEENGVRHFVNLTFPDENKITPYNTEYNKINFPIIDASIPTDWLQFSIFLAKIINIIYSLKKGELIYIHCKGGHGRAGLVVACLFCYIFGMTPHDALIRTSICHNNREVMRDRWREIGSPQTHNQKQFVYKFFRPVYLHGIYIELNGDDMEVYHRVKNTVEKYPDLKSKLITSGLKPITGCGDKLGFWLGKVREELYVKEC